jgi:hypothetical protein
MKTRVHTYSFDLTKEPQREEYAALRAKLTARGLRKFDALGETSGREHRLADGTELELDPKHLFGDQWNTEPVPGVSDIGLRVFDWREPTYFNNGREITSAKNGYWLEQTYEMRAARRETYACGYCGHQIRPLGTAPAFHEGCIDSEYLKAAELHLLRYVRVDAGFPAKREPLTDAERDELLPKYRDAQLHGSSERGKARAIKLRQQIQDKATAAASNAATERDGMLWVLDNFGPGLVDNCIYYMHARRFAFGWRKPLDEPITSAVVDKISEFPFAYTLVTESRGKLESAPTED